MRIVLSVCAAILLLPTAPSAVAGQTPPVLRGRIVAAADNIPLRRAKLTVVVDGKSGDPVYADDAGAFELPIPERGTYRVLVTKAGYAPLAVPAPRDRGEPMSLAMVRGAVIRGKVVDSAGDPYVNISVMIEPSGATGPEGYTTIAETDDRGEFRFGNLPAGRYQVRALRTAALSTALMNIPPELLQRMNEEMAMLRSRASVGTASGAITVPAITTAGEETVVTLEHEARVASLPYAQVGGAISGLLLDEFGEPIEATTVRLWLTRFIDGRLMMVPTGTPRAVDDTGRFRIFHIPAGRYIVQATREPYLPVFFPGRFESSSATVIEVTRGSETAGVDMVVPQSRGARVFGVALSSEGTPLTGEVVLVPSQTRDALPTGATYLGNGLTPTPLSAYPAADGTFSISGVPPGTYALQAMRQTISGPSTRMVVDRIDGVTEHRFLNNVHVEGITEFATQQLTIGEGEYGPLTLTTVGTAAISGTVTADGPGQLVALGDFIFTAVNVEPDQAPVVRNLVRPAVIQPNGGFRLSGLTGRSLIVLQNAPAGWWLKSVNIGGTNAAETPVDFNSPADSRDDVTIVVARTGATISGKVRGDAGVAVSVVVFPVDPEKRLGGPRFFRTTGLDADGSFNLNSFPPGQYYVIAVEEEDADSAGDWENPERQNALAPLAQRVTVSEGGSAAVELTPRRAPRP